MVTGIAAGITVTGTAVGIVATGAITAIGEVVFLSKIILRGRKFLPLFVLRQLSSRKIFQQKTRRITAGFP